MLFRRYLLRLSARLYLAQKIVRQLFLNDLSTGPAGWSHRRFRFCILDSRIEQRLGDSFGCVLADFFRYFFEDLCRYFYFGVWSTITGIILSVVFNDISRFKIVAFGYLNKGFMSL